MTFAARRPASGRDGLGEGVLELGGHTRPRLPVVAAGRGLDLAHARVREAVVQLGGPADDGVSDRDRHGVFDAYRWLEVRQALDDARLRHQLGSQQRDRRPTAALALRGQDLCAPLSGPSRSIGHASMIRADRAEPDWA